MRQEWSDAIAQQFEEATEVEEGLKKPHDRARELILTLSCHGQLQELKITSLQYVSCLLYGRFIAPF